MEIKKLETIEQLLAKYGLKATYEIEQKEFTERLLKIDGCTAGFNNGMSEVSARVEKMILFREAVNLVTVGDVKLFKEVFQVESYPKKVPDYFVENIYLLVRSNRFIFPLSFQKKEGVDCDFLMDEHQKNKKTVWGSMFEEEEMKRIFSPIESKKKLEEQIKQEEKKWLKELEKSVGMKNFKEDLFRSMNIE